VNTVIELTKDENKQKKMMRNIAALAVRDADMRIARLILSL
jgi:hypothetical protein